MDEMLLDNLLTGRIKKVDEARQEGEDENACDGCCYAHPQCV
jgi:hypothetical protein